MPIPSTGDKTLAYSHPRSKLVVTKPRRTGVCLVPRYGSIKAPRSSQTGRLFHDLTRSLPNNTTACLKKSARIGSTHGRLRSMSHPSPRSSLAVGGMQTELAQHRANCPGAPIGSHYVPALPRELVTLCPNGLTPSNVPSNAGIARGFITRYRSRSTANTIAGNASTSIV